MPEPSDIRHIDITDMTKFIFVREDEYQHIAYSTLLHKILEALKENNAQDLKIISSSDHQLFAMNELFHRDNSIIICFGIKPVQLQLQGFDNLHQVYSINNNSILFAESLDKYSDDANKKILWKQLKILFQLS
jgi:Tat protein secretion system quality control protein TatD with DNase activity